MKKTVCMFLAAALMLSMAGCRGSEPKEPEVITEFTLAPEPETTEVTVETEPVEETGAVDTARMDAYEEVLKTLLYDYKTPDGTQVWFDNGFGEITKNSFAIADVDGDGEQELVIWFSTAPTAGMCGWVYGFDGEQIYEETSVFPAMVFYTGGLMKAEWSHNQGLAGDKLWPYTLMGYNPETRAYEVIAQVDAWDRALRATDFDGVPYPSEIDAEKAGVIYMVTQLVGGEPVTDTIGKSAYDAWYAGIFGSAEEITLDPQMLTEENVLAVSPN